MKIDWSLVATLVVALVAVGLIKAWVDRRKS